MSTDTALFMLGGLLLLAGILGGGFEVKELKIPQIRGGTRMLAGLVGITLITMGIGMQENDKRPPIPRASSMTTFTIRDRLGQGQVSEQVRILIDGQDVGTLAVNEHYPDGTITVAVPSDGQHSYVLEARAVFNLNGKLREIVGAGQGMINVSTGKVFELSSTLSGDTWLAHMEDVSR